MGTTNHPEKLDPALIRPGRIDKKFLLDYMQGAQAAQMIAHYFSRDEELALDIKGEILTVVDGCPETSTKGLEITPARLEQLCAEHDTLEEMLTGLKMFKNPLEVVEKKSVVEVDDVITKQAFGKGRLERSSTYT